MNENVTLDLITRWSARAHVRLHDLVIDGNLQPHACAALGSVFATEFAVMGFGHAAHDEQRSVDAVLSL